MASYHENATPTATARPLRRFESISVPPIRLILDAILAHCGIGGTIAPGVRVLGEWSGVTLGLISGCLRQLDAEGIVLYDGRNITLLVDPDAEPETDRSPDRSHCDEPEEVIDQVIDQPDQPSSSDRSGDRSLSQSPLLAAIHRVQTRWNGDRPSDRSPDRSALLGSDPPLDPPMVHDYLAAADSAAALKTSTNRGVQGGESAIDHLADRHPAALILAELGADDVIIADALAARPDLTPAQVRNSWAHFEARIAAGRCDAGAFFAAIRKGKLHAAPRDIRLDPAQYAGDDLYLLGSTAPPEQQQPAESLYDRAQRLIPRDVTGVAYRAAMDVLMRELAAGASDDQALDALAQWQPRRAGGAP